MCVCASQDRIKSQKSNIIYERFLMRLFSWKVDICIMYLLGKKRFSKESFQTIRKGTKILIGWCDFWKYRNADMILVEVI